MSEIHVLVGQGCVLAHAHDRKAQEYLEFLVTWGVFGAYVGGFTGIAAADATVIFPERRYGELVEAAHHVEIRIVTGDVHV